MRTIYLLISFSIYCLHVLGQTDTEIIYKSTSNNAYYMHYYSGFVSIGNNVYPLSGKENPLNWQDWYHFDWREVKISTFGIVLLKLVFDDLWAMPTTGKIIVFIILGLILLILSFLYQKLKDVLFKNDEDEVS